MSLAWPRKRGHEGFQKKGMWWADLNENSVWWVKSTSDTANVNVYNLSDVMLLEEIYEHYSQARSSILFSASLPDSPPHRNTSIELSNICQQKIECNYPQRNPKYLPGTLNTCSCGFSFLIPATSAKRSSEAPPQKMNVYKKNNTASWEEGSCSAT